MTKTKTPQTMEELLSKKNRGLKTFRRGEVVEGTVISKNRREVFVDLGAKSEGIISSREIEDDSDSISDLQIGDRVIAFVAQAENDQGYTILSLKRAESERSWRRLEEAFANKEVLTVKVVDSNKGGLVVEVLGGTRGFVPFSHLMKSPSDEPPSSVIGQEMKVVVIEIDRANNRLVFSEKTAAFLSNPQIKNFYKNLKPGKKMKGAVSSISSFGVFVELAPGIEGLVHISEVSWERIGHPNEVVKEGDRVEVELLSVDEENGQLALSMKTLQKNPWEEIAKKYRIGQTVNGVVTKTAPFGAFVRLPEGVEGLIHVSETTGPLYENDEVKAVVINLEPKKQKLGLSVKRLDR
jgi:small subunit ribosomal protein S1